MEDMTPADAAVAKSQGWELHYVYDLKSQKWGRQVLPADALSVVIDRAKHRDAVCIKALKLIHEFNMRKT